MSRITAAVVACAFWVSAGGLSHAQSGAPNVGSASLKGVDEGARKAADDKEREKLENEAILRLVEADAKAGGKSLNYAKDINAQNEFDRELAALQPVVKALGLSAAQHVQGAHAMVVAKRLQLSGAAAPKGVSSIAATTKAASSRTCNPGDSTCKLSLKALDAFMAEVAASAPAPKQPAKLGSIDTWRYRRCQENAAQAPTLGGVNQGMRLCREQFDQ